MDFPLILFVAGHTNLGAAVPKGLEHIDRGNRVVSVLPRDASSELQTRLVDALFREHGGF